MRHARPGDEFQLEIVAERGQNAHFRAARHVQARDRQCATGVGNVILDAIVCVDQTKAGREETRERESAIPKLEKFRVQPLHVDAHELRLSAVEIVNDFNAKSRALHAQKLTRHFI
jgi:hypothetical protein